MLLAAEISLNQHSGSQMVLPVSIMDSCFTWGVHLPLEQQSWEHGGEEGPVALVETHCRLGGKGRVYGVGAVPLLPLVLPLPAQAGD